MLASEEQEGFPGKGTRNEFLGIIEMSVSCLGCRPCQSPPVENRRACIVIVCKFEVIKTKK